MGGVVIGRDQGEVEERGRWLRAFLPALANVPLDGLLDELRRRHWLAGTPDEISYQLKPWAEAGVQRMMLQWYDLDNIGGLALLTELQQV